jgi:hypothetical protein
MLWPGPSFAGRPCCNAYSGRACRAAEPDLISHPL